MNVFHALLRHPWLRSRQGIFFLISGLVFIVLLCSVALFLSGGNKQPVQSRTIADANKAATATNTSIVASTVAVTTTSTVAASPTATLKPHPLPVPTNNPPPAHNPTPIPAAPTATPIRPTPTPSDSPTPCPDGPCPTPTPSPTPLPTATPGPCQTGGAPYYVTPVANPSSDQIVAAITTAANTYGIPVSLQEAIAWQESGWQQNVGACDSGIGLMQMQMKTPSPE
jgi:hypothetical protein